MGSYAIPFAVDADSEQRFFEFILNYDRALSNRLVQRFFSHEPNYRLFAKALCYSTEGDWEKLDHAFRKFYIEVRFVDYMNKVIWRFTRDFIDKSQRQRASQLLILNQPGWEKDLSAESYKKWLTYRDEDTSIQDQSLLSQVTNYRLYNFLNQLPERQYRILELYYMDALTQREIADLLGVSQQYISKTIRQNL